MRTAKILHAAAMAAGLLGAALVAPAAVAQQAPPIRFIVPFTPGGGNDILARVVAPYLSKKLNRNVVVENKPGASGNIGTAFVANAAPDGNTILMAGSQITTNPALGIAAPFDVEKDFEPIGMVAEVPMIFVVNPKLPYTTMKEFVAYAKAHPGEINFSSPGVGVPQHLAGELLAGMAGIKLTHVPYQGTGPSLTDVLSGQVQSTFGSMGSVLQYIKTGAMRPLGVARNRRTPALPDVPAFSESKDLGLGSYNASLWFSILAPAKTPRAMVDKLNEALNDALKRPEVRKTLADQGFEILMTTPAQLKKIIHDDLALWTQVAKDNHLAVTH